MRAISKNESGLPWNGRRAPIDTGPPPCRIYYDADGNPVWNCDHEHVASPLGIDESDIYDLPEARGWTAQS